MTDKTLKLKPHEIASIALGRGDCVASDRIVVDGQKVGYMHRETPTRPDDSGWRFNAGDESGVYVANNEHFGVYDVNTLANYDPDILPFLDAAYGSRFERDEAGELRQIRGIEPMFDLANAYRPLIGKTLDALAWRPMRSDTPGVVADLDGATLEFTGAVSLFFAADEIALSWFNGSGGNYHLYACKPSDWSPFSLDLVHVSTERPWGEVVGARLVGVEFFTHPTIPDQCVAARHAFARASQEIEVWIGVGANGRMEGSDDLLARIGGKPDNLDELELMEALRAH